MSTVQESEHVTPTEGKYNSSLSSKVISGFSIIAVLVAIGVILFGTIYLLVSIIQYQDFNHQIEIAKAQYEAEFRAYVDAGNDPSTFEAWNPDRYKPTDSDGGYLNPTQTLRTGIFLILGAAIAIWVINKIYNLYGQKSISLSNEGISITSFKLAYSASSPVKLTFFPKKFIPWESVLDIVVKKSDSVFATLNRNLNKAVIYTMDTSYTIESMSFQNSSTLMDKLRIFGDSLDERVIDFGYGAQLAVVWRRMKRSKVGVLGMLIVVIFTVIAILAAVFTTIWPPNEISHRFVEWTPFYLRNPNYGSFNSADIKAAPSLTQADGSPGYLFGTDHLGRDMFSRIFFGSFYSILIGLIATIISVVLGGFIGAASGYMGGVVDNITMRIADVLMVLPGLPILIMIGATFTPVFKTLNIEGAYYIVVFSVFSLISWSGTARYVRAEVLALKESEYIQAENVLGASNYRIIVKHIIPNTMSTMIIIFTLGVAGSIQSVASLAFLGFGSQSTLVWGDDLASAIRDSDFFSGKVWWVVTFVSLALFLLTLGFNLMGDALRDALDPRLKE